MPWLNLGELLKDLLRRHIDPEDVGVYVPEADPDEEEPEEAEKECRPGATVLRNRSPAHSEAAEAKETGCKTTSVRM